MQTIRLAARAVCLAGMSAMAAAQDLAMPDDCVAIAAQIEIETHAKFRRKSTSTLFYDPGLPSHSGLPNEMTIACPPWDSERRLYSVALSWQQGSVAPKAFYDIAAKAGAILTEETPAALNEASRRCVAKALKSKWELSDVLVPKAKIECQAFARDGGAVLVSIWVRKPEDVEMPDD